MRLVCRGESMASPGPRARPLALPQALWESCCKKFLLRSVDCLWRGSREVAVIRSEVPNAPGRAKS